MPAPYRLAGRYSEPITDRYGNALLTASVAVYLPGTTTLATLYTDATKATTAANPVTSAGVGSKLDSLGNLTLYATPGEYDMVTTANGVTGATVRIVVPLAVDEAAQVGADGRLLPGQSGTLRLSTLDIRDYGTVVAGGDIGPALEAALQAAAASSLRPYVYVPLGIYTDSVSHVLQAPGMGIVSDASRIGAVAINYTGAAGTAWLTLGTFSATPANYYTGSAHSLLLKNLYVVCEADRVLASEGVRTRTAIRDNGSGGVRFRNTIVRGFKEGFYGAYGSDFSSMEDARFDFCDVGAYLGPASQQFHCERGMFSNCAEGVVIEGAQQGGFDNCYFTDNNVSDVTVLYNDVTRSGVTRPGQTNYMLGFEFANCWHESNADGTGTRLQDRHFWVKGDRATDLSWPRGIKIRNPLVVSGGTSSGTASFIDLDRGTDVLVENYQQFGNYLRYVVSLVAAMTDLRVVQRNTRLHANSTNTLNWENQQAGAKALDDFTDSFARGRGRQRAGTYLTPVNPTATTLTQDNIPRAGAIFVDETTTLDRIGCEVVTIGDASAVINLGIYASGADGLPSSRLLDAGSVVATSLGVKELTINHTLAPGKYWLAAVASGYTSTAPQVRGVTGNFVGAIPLDQADALSDARCGASHNGATGAFPATFSTNAVRSHAPRAYVRVS